MKFTETFIKGLYEVSYDVFHDLRGQLIKPYMNNIFSDNNQNKPLNEIFISKSKKNVIRGMHMQIGGFPCDRLVTVVHGEITDVVLDARKNSPTYGQVFSKKLSSEVGVSLFIPSGCAHGFKANTENSVVMYCATEQHHPESDTGILWNSFGFDWGDNEFIISDRDKNFKQFTLFNND